MHPFTMQSEILTSQEFEKSIRGRLAFLKSMLQLPHIQSELLLKKRTEAEQETFCLKHAALWRPICSDARSSISPENSVLDLAVEARLIDCMEYLSLNRDLSELLRPSRQSRLEPPHWNAISGELTYRGAVVRRVRGRLVAKHVVAILDQFQRGNWRDNHITISEESELDDVIKLRDAVATLNRRLTTNAFRFATDGTGRGVLLQYRDSIDTKRAQERRLQTPNKPR